METGQGLDSGHCRDGRSKSSSSGSERARPLAAGLGCVRPAQRTIYGLRLSITVSGGFPRISIRSRRWPPRCLKTTKTDPQGRLSELNLREGRPLRRLAERERFELSMGQ